MEAIQDILREVQWPGGGKDRQPWAEDVAGPLRVLRFLRARGEKAEAARLFQAMLQWRVTEQRFCVEELRSSVVGLSLEQFQVAFAAQPERKYLPAAVLGRSREGALVVYFKAGMWDADGLLREFGKHAALRHEVRKMEWCFWFLHECTVRERKVPYLMVLLDLEGASARHLQGETRRAVLETGKLLQTLYLDAVEVTLVINPPWIFRTAMALVSPMLTERQKKKMQIFGGVADDASRRALHDTVPPELLPPELGGTAKLDLWGREARSAELARRRQARSSDRQAPRSAGIFRSCDTSAGPLALFACCTGARDANGDAPTSPPQRPPDPVPVELEALAGQGLASGSGSPSSNLSRAAAVALLLLGLLGVASVSLLQGILQAHWLASSSGLQRPVQDL